MQIHWWKCFQAFGERYLNTVATQLCSMNRDYNLCEARISVLNNECTVLNTISVYIADVIVYKWKLWAILYIEGQIDMIYRSTSEAMFIVTKRRESFNYHFRTIYWSAPSSCITLHDSMHEVSSAGCILRAWDPCSKYSIISCHFYLYFFAAFCLK